MQGHAFLVDAMHQVLRVLVVLPRTVDCPQTTHGQFDALPIGLHAALADAQLASGIEPNQLIISASMAVCEAHDGRRLVAHRVQASVGGHRAQLAPVQVGRQTRELVVHIVGDVVHEPLEALAVQSLLQRQLLANVAHVQVAGKRLARIEVLLVRVVEPRLDDALVVDRDQWTLLLASQFAEIVGHKAAIDVTHARAWHPLDAAATLPDLEAQFEVLAAPDQQTRIVGAQLQEVLPIDGEQAAGVRGTAIGFRVVSTAALLATWHLVLLVQHAPFEDAAEVVVRAINRPVLKVLVVNAIDNGHCHHSAIPVDGRQQGRQPVGVYLAMGVQEDDHLTCGMQSSLVFVWIFIRLWVNMMI